jgi:hypothetical protein
VLYAASMSLNANSVRPVSVGQIDLEKLTVGDQLRWIQLPGQGKLQKHGSCHGIYKAGCDS